MVVVEDNLDGGNVRGLPPYHSGLFERGIVIHSMLGEVGLHQVICICKTANIGPCNIYIMQAHCTAYMQIVLPLHLFLLSVHLGQGFGKLFALLTIASKI